MDSNYTILHLDDNRDFLDLFRKNVLKAEKGIYVISITSPASALNLINQINFDAVISDYDLPGMNGIEFLKSARKKGYEGAFILLTGQGNEEIAAEALHLGADDYYQKEMIMPLFGSLIDGIESAIKSRYSDKDKIKSQEKFFDVFEKASVVIYELDRNGVVISANKALGDFLGFKQDYIIGKPLIDFVELSYKANFEKLVFGEWDKNSSEIVSINPAAEICLNYKGRKKKYGYIQSVFLFPEGRRSSKRHFQGSIGIINDISRIQSVMQESSYGKIFENVQEGFLLISDLYIITECNKKVCEILGYSKKDLLGKHLESILPSKRQIADKSPSIKEKYLKPAFNDVPQSFYWKYTYKNSINVDFEVTLFKIVLGDKSFLHTTIKDVTERYLVIKDIESSEQRYRQFSDNIKLGACFVKNGRIVFINRRLVELLGYKNTEELIGSRLSALICLQDRRKIQKLVAARENKKLKSVEERVYLIKKNGSYSGMRLMIENSHFLGSSICAIAFIPDTRSAQIERIPIPISVDVKLFIDRIALPLIELDLHGKMVLINSFAENYFKFDVASFLKKTFFSLLSAKYSKSAKNAFSLAIAGTPSNAILAFKTYSGEEYVRFIPIINDKKNVDGVLMEIVKNTESTAGGEFLLSTARNYYALIEGAHEGIAMADPDENIIYLNPAFAKMLKYSTNEILGKSLKNILLPGQWDKVRQETAKRKNDKSNRYSLVMLTKDGEKRKMHLSVSPVKDLMGQYQGGIAVISDITEQEKISNDLRLTNRRLSVLLNVINATHQRLPLKKMVIKALASAVNFAESKSGIIYVFGENEKTTLFVTRGVSDEVASKLEKIDFRQKPFSNLKSGKTISGLKLFPGLIFVPFLSEGLLLGCLGLIQSGANLLEPDDEDALRYLAGEIADGIKQNKYEEQLKEAANKYERLFDQSNVGVLLFNTDFKIIRFNTIASKLTGWKKSEIDKLDVEELIGGKTSAIQIKIEKLHGKPYIRQHKIIKKNDEIVEVSISLTSLLDQKGEILGYQAILLDRTAELFNERRLNYLNTLRNGLNIISEELHTNRPLIEKLDYLTREAVSKLDVDNILIWLLDDANILDFRSGYPEIPLKTLYGKKQISKILRLASYSPSSVVSLIDAQSWRNENSRGLLFADHFKKITLKPSTGSSDIYPFDLNKLKASQISWIGIFPIRGLNGKKIGIVSLLKKIDTERDVRDLYKTVAELIGRIVVESQTNEALKESLSKYRYLYESALSGIYQTSIADGTFISANQTTAQILGYTSVKHLIEKCKFSDLYPQQERFKFLDVLGKNGVINDVEIHATLIDGREVDLLINARIFQKQGYIEGAITDITKLKKLEDELRRKNAEMEVFISSVSHDLKSPLFSISGYTEMLSDPGTDHEKKAEILEHIQRNIKEMSSFISGLLDLSRAGKVIGDISDLPIHSIINSIIREAEINAGDVTFSSDGIPQTIRAGYRIKEVFQNLITNAIQARMENIHLYIKVSCRPLGKYWEFTVRDNGKGIKKENLEKIFIPGFTTSSGKKKGSGFGLSIAKRIIQAHNGGIMVKSNPGEGTEFIILLPKYPSI